MKVKLKPMNLKPAFRLATVIADLHERQELSYETVECFVLACEGAVSQIEEIMHYLVEREGFHEDYVDSACEVLTVLARRIRGRVRGITKVSVFLD